MFLPFWFFVLYLNTVYWNEKYLKLLTVLKTSRKHLFWHIYYIIFLFSNKLQIHVKKKIFNNSKMYLLSLYLHNSPFSSNESTFLLFFATPIHLINEKIKTLIFLTFNNIYFVANDSQVNTQANKQEVTSNK